MLIDLTTIGFPGYSLNPETVDIYGKTGKKLNQRIDNFGYKCVYVEVPGKSKNQRVHKIVANACIPNPDNLTVAQHIDNNKLNNLPSNLRWGTYASNNKQCYAEGRNPGNTKKNTDLIIIEEAIKTCETYVDIIKYCNERKVKISAGTITKYKRMFL